MSALSEYYLGSGAGVVQLDLLEITHPNFSQAYRIVRNNADGITIDLSIDETGVVFDYYPALVEQLGARDDLDAGIKITLGDVGEVLPTEMDNVAEAGGFQTKPQVRYWTARSDTSEIIYGPLNLEAPNFIETENGSAFEAVAPVLNSNKTGERYTLERITMLRGCL